MYNTLFHLNFTFTKIFFENYKNNDIGFFVEFILCISDVLFLLLLVIFVCMTKYPGNVTYEQFVDVYCGILKNI